jgi:hypothetical protein
MSIVTQKLNYKASCKTPFFSHSVVQLIGSYMGGVSQKIEEAN